MKAKPTCPACGQPPASMIEDGYSIDLTPWWRYYLRKFNPFKRRRRMVPMEDVMEVLKSVNSHLETIADVQKTLEKCITRNNHQNRACVRTAHWND